MPLNGNQEKRRAVLDRIFAERRLHYTVDELLEILNNRLDRMDEFTISRRTLLSDIDKMRRACLNDDVDLVFNNGTRRYEYSVKDYSLTGIPMVENDLRSISLALSILQQIQGLNHTRELESIVKRLAEKMGVKAETYENVMLFDHSFQYKGIEHLYPLLNAVIHKQCLKLYYRDYEGNDHTHTIHPYFLKEFNNRWFLFSFAEELQRIANHPLDRIEGFEEIYIPFNQDHYRHPDEIFSKIVGVTIYDEIPAEDILLRFKATRGKYVITKPLHSSQQIISQNAAYIDISLRLIPNKELSALLLSFGSDLEVLHPPGLRDELKAEAQKILQHYTIQVQ